MTVITLERTTCFGSCPAYTLSIAGDGTVTYTGRSYVRVTGERTWKIEPAAVEALARDMERAGYFRLKDRYKAPITDLPTTRTSLRIGDRTKSIEDYFGAPDTLQALERRIDEVAGVKKYVFIDGATLRKMGESGWRATPDKADSIMLHAVETNDADVAKALVDLGYDVNRPTSTGPIILHARGSEVLGVLIAAGADVNATSQRGTTALHRASSLGDGAAVTFLLSRGAAADTPDDVGITPLMEAANSGGIDAVRALLKGGANPAAKDSEGKTAADLARANMERIAALRKSNLLPPGTSPPDYAAILKLLEQK